MNVITRSGVTEHLNLDKIKERIQRLCVGLDSRVDAEEVVMATNKYIVKGISTRKIDEQSAIVASNKNKIHPDYSLLSGRILASDLQKSITLSFSETMKLMHDKTYPARMKIKTEDDEYNNPEGEKCNGPGLHLTDNIFEFIMEHRETLDAAIVKERDFQYDFFAMKTFMKSYLFRMTLDDTSTERVIIETVQYLMMRVACALWGQTRHKSLEKVIETYDLLSKRMGSQATPTYTNAGHRNAGLSSCYLIYVPDSIKGIFEAVTEIALVSKHMGGVGLSVQSVRGSQQPINGTNGKTDGVVPMLKIKDFTLKYIKQGGGKREGSGAIYFEPHHIETEALLQSRLVTGKHETSTGQKVEETSESLFYALWMNDLFIFRAMMKAEWTLFSPDETPDLHHLYGRQFAKRYMEYEKQGVPSMKKLKSTDLLDKIFNSMYRCGMPFVVLKDCVNERNPVKNISVIHSSNLCTEVVQPSNPTTTGICNVATVCLSLHVKYDKNGIPFFDFDELIHTVWCLVDNMNQLIDTSYHPTERIKNGNRIRPMTIGVQGLADAFIKLHLPYTSQEAQNLNRDIFETMYYAAAKRSHEWAIKVNCSYEGFSGSPLSLGQFQFDLAYEQMSNRYQLFIDLCENDEQRHILFNLVKWKKPNKNDYQPRRYKKEFDELRQSIVSTQLFYNSFLIGLCPSASSSVLNCNSESFEPLTSVVQRRTTMSGEFFLVNRDFASDMNKLGLWNEELVDEICENNGSIQTMEQIPQWIRDVYKTRTEVDQDKMVTMSAERQKFICQSQSLNGYFSNPTFGKFTHYLFHAFSEGVKTALYYFRSDAVNKPRAYQVKKQSVKRKIEFVDSILQSVAKETKIEDDDEAFGLGTCSKGGGPCSG